MVSEFLVRKYIGDAADVQDPEVRRSYGDLSGYVGIAVNLLLFGIKLIIGVASSSIAIIGDAIHNLADAGSSVITLIGFKMSSKPADHEHPFGHGRIEYLAGLAISVIILLIGFELMKSSAEKLIKPELVEAELTTIIILTASIVMQLVLGLFNRELGQRISSPAMLAAATDSLSDCVASVVVVMCLLINLFMGINMDGAAGIVVALFIIHSGWGAAKSTIQPLLGEPADPQFVSSVKKDLLMENDVLGVHDFLVHNYGPGRLFVSLHAEVPSTMSLMNAHRLIDSLERRLAAKYNAVITVHMDPVDIHNEQQRKLKEHIRRLLKSEDPAISIHDFRMDREEGIVSFDVSMPYSSSIIDEEITKYLEKEINQMCPGYRAVISIDRV